MTHITRMQMVQIQALVKDHVDMAEIAAKYNISIERVEALTGVTRKANKKAAKAKAEAVDPVDDFSED